jgi:hypothetical protein
VNDSERFVAGEGPLTYGRVLHEAWGMFRSHYVRVASVALVLFIPPPLLIALLQPVRESLEADPALVRGLGYALGLLMVAAIRLLGPVVYAGYLDEAVGREYFGGERLYLPQVLRSLPWLRLVAADMILVVGTAIGLSLLIVPGLVYVTLFSLVGPVIVQERHGIVEGFRRTYQLSRPAWRMIVVLVVALLAVESIVHEIVHEFVHDYGLTFQLMAEWAVAAIVGGVVGLIEVALATELMARSPLQASTENMPGADD